MLETDSLPSYFSVIQYVPNPITDERMNIGVAVVGSGTFASRFITTWGRAKAFGREDVAFLRDFAASVTESSEPQLAFDIDGRSVQWSKDLLEKYSRSWINSIQLTPPRASLRPPQHLLDEIAGQYLRDQSRPRGFRDRRVAVRLGRNSIEAELKRRGLGNPRSMIKQHYEIKGQFDVHSFDFCVANGKVYAAVQGLSFEGPDSKEVQKDTDATAWTVDDVKRGNPSVPLVVIAIPPRGLSKAYIRARPIFEGLGAEFVVEDGKISEWAAKVVDHAVA